MDLHGREIDIWAKGEQAFDASRKKQFIKVAENGGVRAIDCNNFYASCERVFQPSLNEKLLLCCRTMTGVLLRVLWKQEALGIPMGEPAFKIKDLIESNQVTVFSSNYVLYGDMSSRVMATIGAIVPEMEIYSIDEAFIMFDGFENINLYELGDKLVRTVKKEQGYL